MKLIAIDDGHGLETAGKRTPAIPELNGRVIRENEFNSAVADLIAKGLQRCGFNTILTAPGNTDASLSTRVAIANKAKADAFISVHYNAFDGKFDAYDPEGLSIHYFTDESKKLGECVLNHLKSGTPQKNRGLVKSEFYVLKYTQMPSILSENGFMDNKREAMLMLDKSFIKEVADEHIKGICDYFKIKFVPEDEIESLIDDLVTKGVFTNKNLWTKVLKGETVPKPEWLVASFKNVSKL